MEQYYLVKWLHILSSTVLFGTGIGTAFFMMMAHLSGHVPTISAVARIVVKADWIFTATSGTVQPATGLWLVHLAGHSFNDGWLVATYLIYGLALLCWLPVVWLQMKMRDLAAQAAQNGTPLPQSYFNYFRIWFLLGWPAFVGLLLVFYLMVAKPI
jgi:uncharacterized membrane protein